MTTQNSIEETKNTLYDDYQVSCDDREKQDAVMLAAARLVENQGGVQQGIGEWNVSAIDDLRACVELLSSGSNTVLVDDRGLPSVMVRVPAITQRALDADFPETVHPAFTAYGKTLECIYLSKYQNIIVGERAYSLPLRDPACKVRYETAVAACAAKGKGWGLSPYGLRAALALWCRSHELMPHGNNAMEHDYFFPEETGVPTADGRVATGSGPLRWSHNGRDSGVWDLNGNLNEWDSGLRLVDGEIQVYPGSESLFTPEEESLWRAIRSDGVLAPPGSPETLKYTGGHHGIMVTCDDVAPLHDPINCGFNEIIAQAGLTVPQIMVVYALYPAYPDGGYGGGWRWVSTRGEMRPLCGGASRAIDHSGIFFMGLSHGPGEEYPLSGFRSAYAVPCD